MVKKFYDIILYMFLVAAFGCTQKNGLPDMRETYNIKDTHPFGGYVAYRMVKNSFSDNWINETSEPLAESVNWLPDTASLYISISKKLYVTDRDVEKLLDFIYKGNTALIVASEIDTTFLNAIYCAQKNFDWMSRFGPALYDTASVRLVDGISTIKNSRPKYFYYPFANYFTEINGTYCRKVGYNQKEEPNCIVMFWGKGRLFLHCDPRAFSNYFLLSGKNYEYLVQLLQLMPQTPEHIYWSNFYVKKNYKDSDSNFSTLSTIFKYPPLKWAFWIALALLLLYILFNGRRRQRIVPVIPPVENSSVAFAEAIGGLYLKEKSNKTIAEKMITYFHEHIRSRYFLNSSVVNEDFLQSLSRKSGVEYGTIKKLYYDMQTAIDSPEVDDEMLLNLNTQIQEFYKTKN